MIDPLKGGLSCLGAPTPCPNSDWPSSTRFAPPDDPSHKPHATSASPARPPTSGLHSSTHNSRWTTDPDDRTAHRPAHPTHSKRPSWPCATNTAGGRARSSPTWPTTTDRHFPYAPPPPSFGGTTASPQSPHLRSPTN